MYVKASPGLKIRDADLKDLLPDDGRDVPDTDYWQRRLRDGDVVEATPSSAATAGRLSEPDTDTAASGS